MRVEKSHPAVRKSVNTTVKKKEKKELFFPSEVIYICWLFRNLLALSQASTDGETSSDKPEVPD